MKITKYYVDPDIRKVADTKPGEVVKLVGEEDAYYIVLPTDHNGLHGRASAPLGTTAALSLQSDGLIVFLGDCKEVEVMQVELLLRERRRP